MKINEGLSLGDRMKSLPYLKNKMVLENMANATSNTKLLCACDKCGDNFYRRLYSINKNLEKDNAVFCPSCSAKLSAHKKPQCSSEYWQNSEVKENHSNAIKNSLEYQEGIKKRDIKGEKNGMFGKKHTIDTKSKMSKSRTGKIGELATNWQGGKTELNSIIKGILHKKINWYKRVVERDNYKCTNCGIEKVRLDAHHIKPFSKIVKELLEKKEREFNSKYEQAEWLANQPELMDINLENGITLCRSCHKNIHKNWGSHNIK